MAIRVGIGYDIHRLERGKKLLLGGVHIPHPKGLVGHSDADVVLHAFVDAVLGALGEGDIGSHFSDRDPRYRGVSSFFFVRKTWELLKAKRLRVVNLDCTLIAEEPRLGPYREGIRRAIAKAFGLTPDQVSVKAKTNEGLGPVGQKKAIACFAVASLDKESRKK